MIEVPVNTERAKPAFLGAVALLTGGADRPYAYGLIKCLVSHGAVLDVIGNDELDSAEFRTAPSIRYMNFRGDQRPDANFFTKALRVLKYYARLISYPITAKPNLFHILWNNKFEYFDRTLLMLWYRAFNKKIVLTLHNVNSRKRDSTDSRLNRLTLRLQYRLAQHLFVHTERMKQELIDEFHVRNAKITVIPFGINNSVPTTRLSGTEAREQLGFFNREKIILFFGNISPYKGLEYLIAAFRQLVSSHEDYRLVIAGRPKNCDKYLMRLRSEIAEVAPKGRVLVRDEFIPDEETEIYMKAADVLALPYRHVYQSGVLFLAYSFGLPVLSADVGSLRDDIIEGETGFVFRPESPESLAHAIERYFASTLYADLESRRRGIKDYAETRNSWNTVGQLTISVYSGVMQRTARGRRTRMERVRRPT